MSFMRRMTVVIRRKPSLMIYTGVPSVSPFLKICPRKPCAIVHPPTRRGWSHKIDIIRVLADLIDEKVDLENPDRILRIDVIGRYAGLGVLAPRDVFSLAKPYL